MTAPYENAEFIELGTIMPPEKFRTVLPEVVSRSYVRLRLFTQRKRVESFVR